MMCCYVVTVLNISKLLLLILENSHHPFWMVLHHDTWHNLIKLPHGIILCPFCKANYFLTCVAFKPKFIFNILIEYLNLDGSI